MRGKRTGGPKTREGKERCSQNSTRHGVLAKALVVDGETWEEYEAVEQGWRRQFVPADYQEERLVEILIRNDWMLRRADRRYLEAQAEPATSAKAEHRLELLHRYRTAAERSFYRAWNMLRALGRDLERRERETAELRLRKNALEATEVALKDEKAEKEPSQPFSQRDEEGMPNRTKGTDELPPTG